MEFNEISMVITKDLPGSNQQTCGYSCKFPCGNLEQLWKTNNFSVIIGTQASFHGLGVGVPLSDAGFGRHEMMNSRPFLGVKLQDEGLHF